MAPIPVVHPVLPDKPASPSHQTSHPFQPSSPIEVQREATTEVPKPLQMKPPPTRVRGRVISGPIQMEPPPIVPIPIHNVAETHMHSPITKLPDIYIPVIDEHSEVLFPLPPPHELGDIPPTPSMSSRGPFQPTSPTEAQHKATTAAGAAKAFTRGMKSMLKGARRVSATLLREPRTAQQVAAPPVMPISPTSESMVGRRPVLSFIMEGSMPMVPQMPVAYPDELVGPNRHASVPAGMDSGLQNWTAQHYAQQQHRQRMASELRNSDSESESESDVVSETDVGAPRHQRAEVSR